MRQKETCHCYFVLNEVICAYLVALLSNSSFISSNLFILKINSNIAYKFKYPVKVQKINCSIRGKNETL